MSGPKTNGAALADIEALIADFQASGMRELHVRAGDVEIYLSTDASAPGLGAQAVAVRVEPIVPASAAPTATPELAAVPTAAPCDLPDNAVIVRAPYLGTFYRAPKPGSPVYVDVGSVVTADTEMCLVEVMKLFTAVRAGLSGTVHAILATDGAMVEADQPLFAVIPG
ncbi:acetyl-CoA carboxylase, biotin carboxyl carrier protein [Sphingobium lactosutens]|uniref:acetyl-CoA carboxylase biotin carboxyl carrier protein n=1 Tax=Sphingobium lactosutens TaxID=522773 RepID=UPI0015BFFCC7|nr:biotin/lipoyl-containing protein [Sphingobium lactosutens]NWK94417.1 acetyl-CoA carboxylase, biotin carboxyl carrier protein [Sphingobium lactosutens]